MPRLVEASKSKSRYQLAAASAALGVVVVFIAFRFATQPFLISTPSKASVEEVFEELWFTNQDALVGATRKGTHLRIHRWAGAAESDRTWDLELTGAAADLPRRQWATSADLSLVAWMGGDKIHVQRLGAAGDLDGSPVTIALPAERRGLALDILTDGSLAAVFEDATVVRWDDKTGRVLGEQRLSQHTATRAVAQGDYVAIAFLAERQAVLYRFRETWTLAETAVLPETDFDVLIPAPGALATLSAGSLRVGGEIRNTPGPVVSVASYRGSLIASGDFERTLVLPPGEEPYELAASPPRSRIAVGRDHLGISGPAGTRLLAMGAENRLTASGRRLAILALAMLGLAALLAMGPFLLHRLLQLFTLFLGGKTRRDGKRLLPAKLAPPPPALVAACASGETLLWAGAGLSAQCGLPVRLVFVANLLQTAAVEQWIDGDQVSKMARKLERRDPEDTMDELAALGPEFHGQWLAYLQSVIPRYLTLSRSHELLARIPFQAALTTNYDGLLERMDAAWCQPVLTPQPPRLEEPAGVAFLMKLYGNMAEPQTLLPSRSAFGAAARRSGFDAVLGRLLGSRTLLFVGCSLGALLKDLDALGLPEQSGRPHFAVAGAGGSDWQAHAAELKQRYGVESLLCQEETIATALPEFLDHLVREIGRMQPGPGEGTLAQESSPARNTL